MASVRKKAYFPKPLQAAPSPPPSFRLWFTFQRYAALGLLSYLGGMVGAVAAFASGLAPFPIGFFAAYLPISVALAFLPARS